MKGKFLKVSSLFVCNFDNSDTCGFSSSKCVIFKAMDNHPQQTQTDKQQTPKIQKAVTLNH